MFGYVRPLIPQMRIWEYEAYRSCYCALCRTLRKEYGLAASLALSFDMTFLVMLLWPVSEKPEAGQKGCAFCPGRKKCLKRNDTFSRCAGCGVLLTEYKLQDEIRDERAFRRAAAKLLGFLFRRSSRKAKAKYPELDEALRGELEVLTLREKEEKETIDYTADAFSTFMTHLVSESDPDKDAKRILLYQLGRWIYITDAADDFRDDVKSGKYNPLFRRFGCHTELRKEDRKELEDTLLLSCNLMRDALNFIEPNCWSSIVEQIISLGLPEVTKQVLEERFEKGKNRNAFKGYKI